MEPKSQRELALAAMALVVLAIAGWTIRAVGRPGAANAPGSTAAAKAAKAATEQPFSGVDLKALDAERPEPEAGNRNPFRFKPPPAPPPPPPTTKRPPEQENPIEKGPPPPPPLPRITLKYIGDVVDPRKPGAKIAVFTDGRGVYQGREGEVIEGRYRILKIGVESVELSYLDGRGRQTIRQTGQ